MRKIAVFLVLLVVFCTAAFQVFAQGHSTLQNNAAGQFALLQATPEATAEATAVAGVPATRPDLLTLLQNDTDGRFTTLIAALNAADLGPLLSHGPFTLLAPTNDAFAAALSQLGMTQDQLFANKPLLSQILLYHLLPGQYLFRDLSKGPTLPTALANQTVTFTLSDGTLTVNGAALSDVDNLASDGVMHAIDAVILPPAAQALVPTPQPTVEATPEATAESGASVRGANFSANGAAYDLYIDGTMVDGLSELKANSVGDWVSLASGSHNIGVAPAGGQPNAVGSFDIKDGDYVTLAVTGSGDGLLVTPLVEDYTTPASGQARLSAFNGVVYAQPYDVVLNGRRVIIRLGYPGSLGGNDGFYYIDVPAGTYRLQISVTGAPSQVVVDVPQVTLDASKNTLVAIVGSVGTPAVRITVTDIPAQ